MTIRNLISSFRNFEFSDNIIVYDDGEMVYLGMYRDAPEYLRNRVFRQFSYEDDTITTITFWL